ncbi:hypothetical protein ACWC0C_26735 [Streptomyces sp. NPDC001709]
MTATDTGVIATDDTADPRLRPAGADGRAAWEWFMELDEALTALGEGADRRLAYRMSHPITRR